MSATGETIDRFVFQGAALPNEWATSVATGSPTVGVATGGGAELDLTVANEAQIASLYFGDKLVYDIDELISAEFLCELTASVPAEVSGVIGMAGARDDVLNDVAQHAWFRFEGSNTLVAESDDGTTDLDDKSTGRTLSTLRKWLKLDFKSGLVTQGPPALSKGGKSSVLFFAENDGQTLDRVADQVQFDMGAYSGSLQPFLQLQKTAAAVEATLKLMELVIRRRTR